MIEYDGISTSTDTGTLPGGATLNVLIYNVDTVGDSHQTILTPRRYSRVNRQPPPNILDASNDPYGGFIITKDPSPRGTSRTRMVTPPALDGNNWDQTAMVYEKVQVNWPRCNYITDEFLDAFVWDLGTDLSGILPGWFSAQPIRWASSQGDYGTGWAPGLLTDVRPTIAKAVEWPFRHPAHPYSSYGPAVYDIPHGPVNGRLIAQDPVTPCTGFSVRVSDGAVLSQPCINSLSYGGDRYGAVWWGAASVPYSLKTYFTKIWIDPDVPSVIEVYCHGEDVLGNARLLQTFTVTATLDNYSAGQSAQHYEGTFTLTEPIPADIVLLWWGHQIIATIGGGPEETLVPYVPGPPTGATHRHVTGDRLPSAWLLNVT